LSWAVSQPRSTGGAARLPTSTSLCLPRTPTSSASTSRWRASAQGAERSGPFGTVFATKYGRLEIVRRAHAIGHYADWLRGARKHRLGEGLTVVVAAPDDILRSKEAAGREKDRAALPQMRQDFIDAGAL
jgi:hypothetical protein